MAQSHMYINGLDFYCDYCDRSFTRKYNLQVHIENCHMNSSCYCEVCDQKFTTPAALQAHLNHGHNRFDQPFPECDICGRIFTRKQNIVSHMTTIHQQKPVKHQCHICEKTFSSDRNLNRHFKQLHSTDDRFNCESCQTAFRTKYDLDNHIESTHKNKSVQCNMCYKVYTNNRNLKRHVEMHHREREYHKCNICPNKVYTSNQSLRRHMRTAHNSDDEGNREPKGTDDIESGNDNNSLFEQSDDNSSTESTCHILECPNCDEKFSDEDYLCNHIKEEHRFEYDYKLKSEPRKRSNYRCEFCFAAYHIVYDLKEHMKVAHDIEYNLSTCNVCFSKFYSKEALAHHKKACKPPPNVNSCSHCDKLFTDISSLEFHTRIFHPQAQIADSNMISSTQSDGADGTNYKCSHCDRAYYSDRSLKHHMKLKHSTEEAVQCQYCSKICSNKYYLASHIKIVHSAVALSKCDYCDKYFKSKRNIRRHIEYTHMGMQRYKCIECETLFKEKRSLRKHVRTKHPNSAAFPQCHICYKRFESAKSCKIHLKLLHSFNMNTYPCDLCSVSFNSKEALTIHLETNHLAEDEIYKCEECNLVFRGPQTFEEHNGQCHVGFDMSQKLKILPRCIICMKDFSTRKTLKRHIKKFHHEFQVEDLANYGIKRRHFQIDCEDCLKNFNDDFFINVHSKVKHTSDSIIFKCETCNTSYNSLEFAIQRHKVQNFGEANSKLILSDLCTTQMSDEEDYGGFGSLHEFMEAESTTFDIKVELDDEDMHENTLSP